MNTKIEKKIILTKLELKNLLEVAIAEGISTERTGVYVNDPTYKKVDVSFECFLEKIHPRTRILIENE